MKSKFPFYKQLDQMDCVPACLKMIAKHYGKNVSLQYLRDECSINNRGVNLLGISEAAEKINFRLNFIIQSEKDLLVANKLIVDLELNDYVFSPLYNEKNHEFFLKEVLLTKDEILSTKLTMQSIVRNQIINPLQFGKLYIETLGAIYSNLNTSELGNIENIELLDAIANETKINKNWFLPRESFKICTKCIYNKLCPPLSNYDFVLSSFKVCNI